jgi:hypothetical protein
VEVVVADKQEKGEEAKEEKPKQKATEGEKKPAENAQEEEVTTVKPAVVELPPRYILFHLQDGSAIAGDLSVNEITVTTEFGQLTIPVAKIRSFTPGLNSNQQSLKNIQDRLAELASDDYATRERARKQLAALGPKIIHELQPHRNSENAEVKRHVAEILKEFEELTAELEDDEEASANAEKPWIRLDTIETTEFTVTGSIAPQTFQLASKYGPLTIALGDVTRAERQQGVTAEVVRKSISVAGTNLIQRSAKNSGIRVQAGDKVTITASGSIVMSPWGNNARSGPDGMPNYGWYVPNSIPGGALVGRIGDKGNVFKVGAKHTFVAKTSGTLQLAIGMIPDYATEGYNFPGEYSVKIRVEPQ